MIYALPWLLVALFFGLVSFFPAQFALIFLADIWGLGMTHSFSTFFRSDLRKLQTLHFTMALILVFTLGFCWFSFRYGLVQIFSLYFYWQQFHYTKQNLGVGVWSAEKRAHKEKIIDESFYFATTFISLLGLFHDGSVKFFNYEIKNIFWFHLPLTMAIILNGVLFLLYLTMRKKAWAGALTHTLIYSAAYLSGINFTVGWLLLNVLHNGQYLVFMSKREMNWKFLLYALPATTGYFLLIQTLEAKAAFIPVAIGVILTLSLNFTHYIFDGFIWKSKNG